MEGIKLYKESLNLKEIIASDEYINSDESLMICDLTDILQKHNLWMQYMPRVTPFYAVKCNDNSVILKFLNHLGTGFGCASKYEFEKILGMNVAPERIIFAHPTKLPRHLSYAKSNNVTTMTFDSDFELYKIKEYYPNANLVLRICCEAKRALCPLGGKFGCEPHTIAPKLLASAKTLNLNVVGISFHVASNCLDLPIYDEAIHLARQLFNIGKSLGFNEMNLLDIGGGFPGSSNSQFIKISEIVNEALDRYFPGDDVRFIAEPGRYFVTSACQLICKIHSKREIRIDENLQKVMYYLNDGVYGPLNIVVFDHYKAKPKILKYNEKNEEPTNTNLNEKNEKMYKSTVWGPTCDALDIICEDMYLPNLHINDALVFDNLGAYSLSATSGFNGFTPPKVKFYFNSEYNINNINFISKGINVDEGICSSHSNSSDSNDDDSSSSEDIGDYDIQPNKNKYFKNFENLKSNIYSNGTTITH